MSRGATAEKSGLQAIKDLVFAPLRMALLPDDVSERWGLTSLEEERIRECLKHIEGKLLDVGAGRNRLVQRYGAGYGVEVYDWGGGTIPISTASALPFQSEAFDTVTFVACLNHIPERDQALKEAYRVLRPGGKVVVTMISPLVGLVGHKIWWYSEDKHRKMATGELWGLTREHVITLAEAAGLRAEHHATFLYGMNNLHVFRKPV